MSELWEEEVEDLTPFRTFSVRDLKELPQPAWLVDKIIPEASYGVLYGPSGVGKSFALLDILLCVASGTDWHGRPVQQGRVVYFAGEGVRGLYRRVTAWQAANPSVSWTLLDRNFVVVPQVPDVSSAADRRRTESTIDGSTVAVFDTLARCMSPGGLEENSARDVGRANSFFEKLRDRSGAAIWLAHHTGKDGQTERGSVALRGAADTMIQVSPDGPNRLTFAVAKQKDAPEASPIRFRLTEVDGTGSAVLRKDEGLVSSAFANANAKYGIRTQEPKVVYNNGF